MSSLVDAAVADKRKRRELQERASKFLDESFDAQKMIQQLLRMPNTAVSFVRHIQTVQHIERDCLQAMGALALSKAAAHAVDVGGYDAAAREALLATYTKQYKLIAGMTAPPQAFHSAPDRAAALHALQELHTQLARLVGGENGLFGALHVNRAEHGSRIGVGSMVRWGAVVNALKTLQAVGERAVNDPHPLHKSSEDDFHTDRTFEAIVVGMVLRVPLLQLTRVIHIMDANGHFSHAHIEAMLAALRRGEVLCQERGFGGERWRVAFDREAMALVNDMVNKDKQGLVARLKYEMRWWGTNGGRTIMSMVISWGMKWLVETALGMLGTDVAAVGTVITALMIVIQLGYARYLQAGRPA